jgi:hypothetical protein
MMFFLIAAQYQRRGSRAIQPYDVSGNVTNEEEPACDGSPLKGSRSILVDDWRWTG